MNSFDPEMKTNKKRFTHAFSEEGRFLNRFEEGFLEHNFFTFEQMNGNLSGIEDCVRDSAQRIEKAIVGKDAVQMPVFAEHVRRIMAENEGETLISVIS